MKKVGLYTIVDQALCSAHDWDPVRLAKSILDGGAKFIQLRMCLAGSGAFLQLCDRVVAAAEPFNAKVIVNDRVDLVRMSGSHGVHVGQSDLPLSAVRRLLPGKAIVGLSTHNLSQVTGAQAEKASYIAVGPIFETSTKQTGYSARGVELVKRVVARQDKPVVAIGGITLSRVPEIMGAGAAGVAVISDLLIGNQPERRVRSYLDCLEGLSK